MTIDSLAFPRDWEAVPLKYVLKRSARRDRPEATLLSVYRDHGVVPKDSRTDNHNRAGKDLAAYLEVREGDLVVNKMKAWQGSLAVSRFSGIVSPAYFVFRVADNVVARFLHYQLRSRPYVQELHRLSDGVRPSQWDLDLQSFGRCLAHLPSAGTQNAIADFLDRKTAAIDGLIEKKQRLLALLAEKRSALINQAVTKGLDPNVPMKESGVPWIGRIPCHWILTPLKFVAEFAGGYAFSSEDFQDSVGVPVVRMSDLKAGRLVAAGAVRVDPRLAREAFALRASDILVGMSGSLDNFAVVEERDLPAQLNQRVGRIRSWDQVADAAFLSLVVQSSVYRAPVWLEATTTAQANVSPQSIKDTRVALPPLMEQRQAVKWLRRRDAALRAASEAIDSQLARLREYRQAMITAAVTGQLDIEEAA